MEKALEALERAVAAAGGQNQFARLHGVKQSNVWYWLRKMKYLPGEYVLKTEAATGIPRHLLRPDLYPVEAGGAG